MSWASTQPSIHSGEHVSSKCKAAQTTQWPHAVNNHISSRVCHSAMIWKAESGEHSRNYRGRRGGKGVDMKWRRKKRKGDEEDSTEEVISLSRFCILLPRHVCSCQHQGEGESAGLALRHQRMNDSFWFFFPLLLSLILLSPSTIGG